MNQFDRRQLEKMRQVIEAFKENSIILSSFISSMEFLFHALENVDDSWEELFLEEISALESVNSGVPTTVTEETVKNIVSESIFKLDKLVNDRLQM